MSDTPKLTRMQVDSIRANTERFLKQEGDNTTALLPMLPKRLLLMCDTIDELYELVDEWRKLAMVLADIAKKELNRA